MIVLVALDRGTARVIPDFMDAIEIYSHFWRRVMHDVWLLDTQYPVRPIAEALTELIGPEDKLLVVRVTEEKGGRLHKDSWKWIRHASLK